VESLAEAHDGFAQLFDVAALLADSERLYGHMAASPGMTTYVFDRRATVVMMRHLRHLMGNWSCKRCSSTFFASSDWQHIWRGMLAGTSLDMRATLWMHRGYMQSLLVISPFSDFASHRRLAALVQASERGQPRSPAGPARRLQRRTAQVSELHLQTDTRHTEPNYWPAPGLPYSKCRCCQPTFNDPYTQCLCVRSYSGGCRGRMWMPGRHRS